jgi:hypothetical protein
MFSQFDQVEYCNVNPLTILTVTVLSCFRICSPDFLSNKALMLPDLQKKFEDLVDKTALIKSLKEPEDKIGGNKFSHLCLEDFKETGDENLCMGAKFQEEIVSLQFSEIFGTGK